MTKIGHVITFLCSEEVAAISFDGHFTVHRKLSKFDPRRTVKLKGHRRSMKILREDERSCPCKKKDATRVGGRVEEGLGFRVSGLGCLGSRVFGSRRPRF